MHSIPMKNSTALLSLALVASATSAPAAADIVWTGAVSDDIFDIANWDVTNSTVTTIAPNVTILDDATISNASGVVDIPQVAGQQRFELGPGFTLTIDNSTVRASGNDGVGSFPNPGMVITIDVINGSSFEPFFVVNDVLVDIDATSTVIFGGGGNPVNLSRVDMTNGATLAFLLEDPTEYMNEHLAKTFVDGQPAVVGQNIDVVSDGAMGSIITVISQTIGTPFCPANPNSTGSPSTIEAVGSTAASAGDVTLIATSLPMNQFGIFLTSRSLAPMPVPTPSNGNLCLGGSVGRFTEPAQIVNSGSAGEFMLVLDLARFPQGSSFVPVMSGEAWFFQAWYRDPVGVGSNFTNGVEIGFQ